MLENDKSNLEREYKFYATIPRGQRSNEGAAVAIKIVHKRLNIRTTLQVVVLKEWESAHNSCRYYEVKLSRICIGLTRLAHI